MRHSTNGWPGEGMPWPHRDLLHELDLRLSAAEQELRHQGAYTRDRTNAHSERIASIDERTRKMGARVGKLEDGRESYAATLSELKAETKALRLISDASETRAKSRRDIGQWMMTIMVPLLTAATIFGWVPASTYDKVMPHVQSYQSQARPAPPAK